MGLTLPPHGGRWSGGATRFVMLVGMTRQRIVVVAVTVLVLVVAVAVGVARWQGDYDAGEDVVSPGVARDLVDTGASLIDVRSPEEFAEGHLRGATNVPVESDDFDAQVEPLDRDATYVVYCASGRRAGIAVERMAELGFTDLYNAGGLDDVAGVVAPVVG